MIFNTFLTNFAVCPICTVTVGAGLALSEYLGIDDTVASVWIGGLLASLSMWTINWLQKKNKTFKFFKEITWLAYYILTFVGLYFTEAIFKEGNELWGIDKIILGTIAGTIVFIGASEFYQWMKKKNNNHAHFPFEKVVIPAVSLLITSLIFYFITR